MREKGIMNLGLFVIYIVMAIGLGINMVNHGASRKENFCISLAAKGISLVLIWWALGWRFI